ncbi:guanylate cyclase 2G-like [Tachypleus tridentatus]|uniref:guanylate cyclase 2G-like n=1 Tax=Tachypleus tridentatus TaxID=6853 RepID=UPI003FD4D67F
MFFTLLVSIMPLTVVAYTAKIVTIVIHSAPKEPFSYEVVIPSVNLAVLEVKKLYPHIKFVTSYRKNYTNCISHTAGALAAEEYYKQGVSVFVGPGCSFALDSVARMATYWNIPVCTAAGFDAALNDENIFKTFMRIMANTQAVSRMIIRVLQSFRWRHAEVFYDKSMSIGLVTARAIQADLSLNKYDKMELEFEGYYEVEPIFNFTAALQKGLKKARAIKQRNVKTP